MFEGVINFFKNIGKKQQETVKSKDAAKERLHLVLMQDRANVSADFLDLMKQEIIEVIKKYIDVDENAIDVRLTNKANGDGTTGAPALYANIPIVSIKEEVKSKMARQDDKVKTEQVDSQKEEDKKQEVKKEEKQKENKEQSEEVKEDENKKENQEDKKEQNENMDQKEQEVKKQENENNKEIVNKEN